MGLILRTTLTPNSGNSLSIKGTALSYVEGDGNFMYLLTNMSGSNVRITGSTGILGNTVITGSLDVNGTIRATSTIYANNLAGVVYNTASVGDVRLRGDNVGGGLDGGDYILKTNIAYYGNVMTDSALTYFGFNSGSGTSNFIAKYKGSTTLGNSLIYDNGTNVGIGTTSPSLKLDVSGSDALLNDIRVGRGSGNRVTNSVLGYQVLLSNTTGFENVAIGYSTLASNTTGSFNTAIGSSTLLSNTTGYNNTAIGSYNLQFNTTGSNNTALGYGALPTVTTGDKNTGIGVSAGTGITTGRANVIIGGVTGLSSTLSNNVIIADGDGNQRININSTGSVTLSDVLVLPFSNPLPSNRPTGSVAISGSGGTFVGMFVYNGTTWTNVKA